MAINHSDKLTSFEQRCFCDFVAQGIHTTFLQRKITHFLSLLSLRVSWFFVLIRASLLSSIVVCCATVVPLACVQQFSLSLSLSLAYTTSLNEKPVLQFASSLQYIHTRGSPLYTNQWQLRHSYSSDDPNCFPSLYLPLF